MPSANLGLAHSLFAGWRRGSWSSVAWADPEIEFVMGVEVFPDLGTYRGVEAMGEAWSRFLSAWEGFHASEPELIDLGDRVVGLYTIRARGKGSGVEVEEPVAGIFTFRAGKVARLELVTRERGLREAGIEDPRRD
jgi:ketosteroid isomerase-like protein